MDGKMLPEEGQTLLRIQYRMHETIMGFSSQQFYENKLQADDTVRAHTADELPGVSDEPLLREPLVYIDTAGAGFDESWNEILESGGFAVADEVSITLDIELIRVK